MGPSAGPTEAIALPEANGPPKVHEPQGHCPPLSAALNATIMYSKGGVLEDVFSLEDVLEDTF